MSSGLISIQPWKKEPAVTAAAPRCAPLDGDAAKLVRAPHAADLAAPHPLYCVWEVTLQCDLGCRHCGSRAGQARANELSRDEALAVVAQLKQVGVREVTLIGGEAYLRPDWPEIAAAITNSGMVCTMTTGARGLTQERVEQAAAAGIASIAISIDGLEETHDAQRGAQGSWRAAVDAARRLSASSIRLTTNTQINRLSMPELPAIADLMVELGSKAWQIQLTVPMGRAADRPELLLQPYDLLTLFPLLVWIKQTKLEPHDIALMPGNNIGYFGPYEEIVRYGGASGVHWEGCSAGLWVLGLEADGTIKGCPSLPTDAYAGGNVREISLQDALSSRAALTGLRRRTVDDLWGFCRTCYYADICKAGCSWTTHCLLGRPGNNPYCIHRALEFERRGLRERIVRRAAAPGRPFDHGLFEIVEEPMPNVAEDSVLGIDPGRVAGASFQDKGLWPQDTIRERIQKRRPGVAVQLST